MRSIEIATSRDPARRAGSRRSSCEWPTRAAPRGTLTKDWRSVCSTSAVVTGEPVTSTARRSRPDPFSNGPRIDTSPAGVRRRARVAWLTLDVSLRQRRAVMSFAGSANAVMSTGRVPVAAAVALSRSTGMATVPPASRWYCSREAASSGRTSCGPSASVTSAGTAKSAWSLWPVRSVWP